MTHGVLKMAMAAGPTAGPQLPSKGALIEGSSGVRSWRARARLSLACAFPCAAMKSQTCDPLERRPRTRPAKFSLAVARCDCRVQAAQDNQWIETSQVQRTLTLAWRSAVSRSTLPGVAHWEGSSQ